MAILKELKPKLISVIESAELDILEFREQRYNRIFEIHDKILNLNFSTASPVEQELFIIKNLITSLFEFLSLLKFFFVIFTNTELIFLIAALYV
jgi:hypothetical protein